MMYQILYTRRAEKDILQFEPRMRKRVGERILFMSKNPFHYAERLTDPHIGTYRFRIGDYRVIFDIAETSVIILRIGHRRDIYRR